ncbi:hypothetical protein LCGC14_2776660 [marine sediment metagenome]|uniref:Uncharacterized protein n=1 Tax=marine sediment metagenome TaxID=412755 RepID=A0A0F8YUF0_9ZZZZ
MNNKQCLAKLGRMGVPHPPPGEPYTFFKLLTKKYQSPYYGNLEWWKKGGVIEEPIYDSDLRISCGRGLNLLLDEPPPRLWDASWKNSPTLSVSHDSQLLKVYVMPEDMVCVPRVNKLGRTDKIRVRKLLVGPRVTYKDWLATLQVEGMNHSARRQKLLDTKRQERKVRS